MKKKIVKKTLSRHAPLKEPSRKNGSAQDLKNLLKSGLYLVATPIGNLRDITLRALDVLRDCDLILCEDTRVTRKLLSAFEIRNPLVSFHDYSEDEKCGSILSRLREGAVVALVSDAGMPLISDPGYKLVRACAAEGLFVTSLPGANAPLAALQLSGIPVDAFSFAGFLPSKRAARKESLEKWAAVDSTLIFFESARRLPAMLADLGALMPGRDAAVVREITKMFEETRRGTVAELSVHYQEAGPPKGEVVVVVGPPGADCKKTGEKDMEGRMRVLLRTLKTRDAANVLASETGMPRKEAYDLALMLAKEKE